MRGIYTLNLQQFSTVSLKTGETFVEAGLSFTVESLDQLNAASGAPVLVFTVSADSLLMQLSNGAQLAGEVIEVDIPPSESPSSAPSGPTTSDNTATGGSDTPSQE